MDRKNKDNTTSSLFKTLADTFGAVYNCKHEFEVFAPGRANIIGEHTDYNDGLVLPFAICQGIWFLAAKNHTISINIHSYNESNNAQFYLDGDTDSTMGWTRFISQVLKQLSPNIKTGIDIVFGGDMPIGGGVSSSSSLTCGMIDILNQSNNLATNPQEMVTIAVRSEHGTGVIGGIMDQFTIINGVQNQAILLDCQDQSTQMISMPRDKCHFYLVNTGVKHNLVETDYNVRRRECNQAIEICQKEGFSYKSLREICLDDMEKLESILPELLYRRVRHVVSENMRVVHAVRCLEENDLDTLGILLHGSHDSLRDDYEVSCDELDWQVDYAKGAEFNYGSRMMGGGFGGCTIHMTKAKWSETYIQQWQIEYKETFGIDSHIIEIGAGNGIWQQKQK